MNQLPDNLSSLTHLRRLNLQNVPLTSLPEDILQLPQSCTIIDLDASRLSEAVHNRLRTAMSVSGYTGPTIHFYMGTPQSIAVRPLNEEVTSWLQEAAGPSNPSSVGWGNSQETETPRDYAITSRSRFAKASQNNPSSVDWRTFQGEVNADNFSQFLGRLRQTSEYRDNRLRPGFQQRVKHLLEQLQQHPALRQKCFLDAADAVTSCGDRVALAFLNMEKDCVTHQAQIDAREGKYDNNPAALVELAKGMFRLRQLTEIAHQKVGTLRFVDEIEVHLGYLVQLSKKLQLPVQMNTMLFPRCASLTDQDVVNARKILTGDGQEGNHPAFLTFLASWSALEQLPTRSPIDELLHRHLGEEAFSAIEDEIKTEVAKAQERLQEELSVLEDAPPQDYLEQANRLRLEYDALDSTIATKVKQKSIEDFLKQHRIDASLRQEPS